LQASNEVKANNKYSKCKIKKFSIIALETSIFCSDQHLALSDYHEALSDESSAEMRSVLQG
jgi:hypothetical protein